MEPLSAEDYRRVLAAVEILGRADDYSSFPERMLDAVMTAIEVDFASYSEVDLGSGRNRFLIRPDVDELPAGAVRSRFIRRFGNHPIVAHRLRNASWQEAPTESFLDRLRLLGMVGNCCGEAEVLLNLGLTLEKARRRLVGLSINRGVRDFDQGDAARFNALKPHIVAAHRIAMQLEPPERNGPDAGAVAELPLTARESQVLYWVAMGKTNGEVGTILGARPLTVKKHLEHIYDKLGVPNRTAAARLARSRPVVA